MLDVSDTHMNSFKRVGYADVEISIVSSIGNAADLTCESLTLINSQRLLHIENSLLPMSGSRHGTCGKNYLLVDL